VEATEHALVDRAHGDITILSASRRS
jgi:hypothetical protein